MNSDLVSRKALIEAPTVDAVEVVRCKDCKQCRGWKNAIGIKWYKCALLCTDIEPNDFCSHGERKENERTAD